jgi:uncharacterized protein YjbI with pentapeptide repeats
MNDSPAGSLTRPAADELAEALRRHAWFRSRRPSGRRAVLTDMDLSGLTLVGLDLSYANLTGSSFRGSDLSFCRFDGATVFGCDFRQANLRKASFVHTDLRGCNFGGATLTDADLSQADLREGGQIVRDRDGAFRVPDPSITGRTVFHGANLTNASLSGVFAAKTDFSDAVLSGCRLNQGHLRGANFSGCDLERVDFSQADMRDVCLRGATLIDANFTKAAMAGADMADTITDPPRGRPVEKLADLLEWHLQFLDTKGASGRFLNLDGFDLRGAQTLAGARLSLMQAHNAIFSGLDLTGAELQAARCKGGDFRKCRFDEADLRGICLAGAKLDGASLRKADLRPVRIASGPPIVTDLSYVRLRHANLCAAVLDGCDFTGADFSFSDLTGASIGEACLAGARMVGCRMSDEQRLSAEGSGAVV